MPPYFHEGFENFVELVLPILQERGLVRAEYEGTTLDDHFSLAPPPIHSLRRVLGNVRALPHAVTHVVLTLCAKRSTAPLP
jgi:hypothetical protein